MQSLIEIEKELEGEVIDENLCISLIEKGNELKGYGLYLAKEVVHKESETGWDLFCNKIGVSKRMANYSIDFYKAKLGTIVPDSLPNKEGQFRELPGSTVEEKVEAYKEVKEVIDKEEPTALDISIVKKVKQKATSDIVRNAGIKALNTASTKVREAFVKNPTKISVITEMLNNEEADEDIIEVLSKTESIPTDELVKSLESKTTQKERNAFEKSIRLNIKENTKDIEESADKLFRFFISIDGIIKVVKKNERLLQNKMSVINTKFKNELATLRLLSTELTLPDSLKKAYKKRAKEAHPDLGGSEELMAEVNNAYAKLKVFIEGNK